MGCVLIDGFVVYGIVAERIAKYGHALIITPIFSIRKNIVTKNDVAVLCLRDSHCAAEE